MGICLSAASARVITAFHRPVGKDQRAVENDLMAAIENRMSCLLCKFTGECA